LANNGEHVEKLRSLHDVVMSVYFRVQELKAIYLHNHNKGIIFDELGPYDAPLDYKLNQLEGDVEKIKDFMGLGNEASIRTYDKVQIDIKINDQ